MSEPNLNQMLSSLNSSVTSLFSGSTRTPTMLPQNHKCNENNCAGSRFSGCNLLCSRCLLPKFVECVSDRTEMTELLKLLCITPDRPVTQSLANENMNKMNTLFGKDSSIKFVCPQCLENGSFLQFKMKFEEKVKSLEKKNTELRKEKKNTEEKLKSLENDPQCSSCLNINDENTRLKSDIDSLNDKLNHDKYNNYESVSLECARLQGEIENLNDKLNAVKCNKCDEFAAAFGSIETFSTEIGSQIDALEKTKMKFRIY